jgi:hypothetical protein
VIQDHLGFLRVLALGLLAELDESLCIEPAVRIAFEAARRPGKVDEESIENVARECARCTLGNDGLADLVEVDFELIGDVRGPIRNVVVEQAAFVASWRARSSRPRDVFENVA